MPYEYNVEMARLFGETIVRTRRQADLSQEALGFLADLHRTQIGHIERGLRLPRIDTVVKLAGSLEIPPGDLFMGMAWKPGPLVAGGHFIILSPSDGEGESS